MTDQNEHNTEQPDPKEILKLIGEMIEAGDLENAEKALTKYESEFEENSEALRLRGLLYRSQKDPEKALECLEKATDLDKNNYDAYISLAQLLESLGLFDEGASVLFMGARDSDRPLAFYRLIERYSTVNRRPDFAHRVTDELKKRYKNRPELDFKMGEASFYLKLYIQAIEYFRRCLQKGFDEEFLYFYLACSLTNLGYNKNLPDILRKAILKKPGHIAAYEILAEHFVFQERGIADLLIAGIRSASRHWAAISSRWCTSIISTMIQSPQMCQWIYFVNTWAWNPKNSFHRTTKACRNLISLMPQNSKPAPR